VECCPRRVEREGLNVCGRGVSSESVNLKAFIWHHSNSLNLFSDSMSSLSDLALKVCSRSRIIVCSYITHSCVTFFIETLFCLPVYLLIPLVSLRLCCDIAVYYEWFFNLPPPLALFSTLCLVLFASHRVFVQV